MKLSRVFPGTVKPMRTGIYQRCYDKDEWLYCRWVNGFWMYPSDTADRASVEATISKHQSLPWRGIIHE